MTRPSSAQIRFFYSPAGSGAYPAHHPPGFELPFLEAGGQPPGFVIPILEAGRELLVQNGLSEGIIDGFEPWWLSHDLRLTQWASPLFMNYWYWTVFEGTVVLRTATVDGVNFMYPTWHDIRLVSSYDNRGRYESATCTVGEPVRLAFCTAERDRVRGRVLVGAAADLRKEMRRIDSDDWVSSPFRDVEVAAFVGDRRRYESAVMRAASLMADDNAEIAEKWRRFMLDSTCMFRAGSDKLDQERDE
jgi:hypothetical protein